jgi:hypothetical protein
MRFSGVIFAVAALALSSCAEDVPSIKWSRPGTNYDQFVQDRGDCASETREHSQPFYVAGQRYGGRTDALDSGLFFSCMNARGYRQDPKGFAPPPDSAFALTP